MSVPQKDGSAWDNALNFKTLGLTPYVVNVIKDELWRDNASNSKRPGLTTYIINAIEG
jgi:hypothetical protein